MSLGWPEYAFAGCLFAAIVLLVVVLMWPRSHAYHRTKQIALFGSPPASPAPRGMTRTVLIATVAVIRAVELPGRADTGSERAGPRSERAGPRSERSTGRWGRAGIRRPPSRRLAVRIGAAVAAGAMLGAMAGRLAAVMGLALGWLFAQLYQSLRVDRRTSQFAEALPDALQLVIGSLRSGFSLQHALDSLVRESVDPIAAEFGRAMAEHRLGVDISDALERVAKRTQSEDLEWTVMAVRIQREVGGNLAEVLQTTVDTMRERARLRRHVRALSAEGRLSAVVLVALPVVLTVFMLAFRREYLMPLFTDPLGLTMVLGGSLLFVIGILWMSRVVKVEA